MERFVFWLLFVVGVVFAAWVPATSAYPDLGQRAAHVLLHRPS